ncbi:hypothetical protein [Fibrobacter succinogenes]|uniref:hypothetical protein n=1 Tax=Fibrobacter succinogenes TaxID=833 RepID=UPI00156A277F|nr:hypothetical protein [Fibrobacter succinogenes]
MFTNKYNPSRDVCQDFSENVCVFPFVYDAHAQKRDEESVRLLNVALKYFPDDASLIADLLEMQSGN